MYRVIHFFTDLQDFDYPYDVGDVFPRHGKVVSDERLEELSTNKNRQKKPLIKKVFEEVKEVNEEETEELKHTKTSISRLSTAELRELALKHNVEGAQDKTGSELKKILVDLLV